MTAANRRFPTAAEGGLLALSFVAASVWATANWRGDAGGALLVAKGATVGAIVLLALGRRRETPGGVLLAGALGAHALGDLLIEWRLLAGVAAFFVGHLGYIALFWPRRRTVEELGGGTKLALGTLALFAATFVAYLAPSLKGAERWAIPVYVAALVAMAGCALISSRARLWIAIGALAYVASDALLSLDLFGRGAGHGAGEGRHLVWPLYAAAQLAIAGGWLGAYGDGSGHSDQSGQSEQEDRSIQRSDSNAR